MDRKPLAHATRPAPPETMVVKSLRMEPRAWADVEAEAREHGELTLAFARLALLTGLSVLQATRLWRAYRRDTASPGTIPRPYYAEHTDRRSA